MTSIQDLPLDAWVVVMLNVHDNDMLNSFNKLINCQAIHIPVSERLNAFWIVMSQARIYNAAKKSIDLFSETCDADAFKSIYDKLHEMGFDSDATMNAVRHSNGKLEAALDYLGVQTWY
jgi:hypothetical protein